MGVEALARWHHAERGWVPPKEFIPVAEETGLILVLGEQVLRTACAQAATWPRCASRSICRRCSSATAIFLGLVRRVLQDTGLEANRLELEITEGVLLADREAALGALGKLRELGVRIAMDDFGTGYSSLSYLQKFPFDTIKIDGSFIGASRPGARPTPSCGRWSARTFARHADVRRGGRDGRAACLPQGGRLRRSPVLPRPAGSAADIARLLDQPTALRSIATPLLPTDTSARFCAHPGASRPWTWAGGAVASTAVNGSRIL